jgi:hypothetical protein
MNFFFPDSHDFVDGSFDFHTERRSEERVRQQHDLYPHEILESPPYDGMLVSKAVVDGVGGASGKYSIAQRQRLLRVGVREFFRLAGTSLLTMGDCGAFTYVRETVPPFTPAEVVEFYLQCGFDLGLSVDHVILGFRSGHDRDDDKVPEEWKSRQDLTIDLAGKFLKLCQSEGVPFTPVGVAQGWSPASYAHAVDALQKQGFEYIAFGGMVPLKTADILDCLRAAAEVRRSRTQFHLLGISRCEHAQAFSHFGVTSFDSTAPLRRAFKDDKHNYYTDERTYAAIRVPQVEGNTEFRKQILAGRVDQNRARDLERQCLRLLEAYDKEQVLMQEVVDALASYENIFTGHVVRSAANQETLAAQPWRKCLCAICKTIGIHVVIFRGAERNRRRGFHNLYVFSRNLRRQVLSLPQREVRTGKISGRTEISYV